MPTHATGVVLLHPAPAERMTSWLDRVRVAAQSMPGFVALRLGHRGAGLADAAAITFDSAEHLQAWLDSPAHDRAFVSGNDDGVLSRSTALLICDTYRLPPGTAVFGHDVIPDRIDGFIAAEVEIAAATAAHPGFDSLILLPPLPGGSRWTSILSFHTDDQLSAWLVSEDRAQKVPHLRSNLARDFTIDAPFGSILRVSDGRPRVTPKWRTAMLVLLVLYPTAMLVTRFIAPAWVHMGAHQWLSTWLTQVLCVAAMTYLLMPLATRRFARWLDPVEGAGTTATVAGTAVVLAFYGLWLTLFALT